MDATNLLKNVSIVPVVVVDDPKTAVPLADTLIQAGFSTIEVTLQRRRFPMPVSALVAFVARCSSRRPKTPVPDSRLVQVLQIRCSTLLRNIICLSCPELSLRAKLFGYKSVAIR